jgi:hypothetical protein
MAYCLLEFLGEVYTFAVQCDHPKAAILRVRDTLDHVEASYPRALPLEPM